MSCPAEAETTVGPKLGNASWFVVSEIEHIPDELLAEHGLNRRAVTGAGARIRMVEGYLGWRGPIEARFLRRAARGPKVEATRELGREGGALVVMIPRDARISGTHVAAYVAWGERHNVHRTYYVRHRAHWYSVEVRPGGEMIMPSSSAFAWKVWRNPGSALMTTSPNAAVSTLDGVQLPVGLAILNSTWTYLAATQAASQVGVEGVIRFGGLTQYQRLRVVDPRLASSGQQERLAALWDEMRDQQVLDFPPAGKEPLSGWRRDLDELVVTIAGVHDPVDASDLVDELYAWLRGNVGRRAEVEEIALAGRRGGRRGGGARRLVLQAVAGADLNVPMPEVAPLTWRLFVPPGGASTDPQAVLFGIGGDVEGPNDVRFGEEWVRFASEAEAVIVRALASADLLRDAVVIPGTADADQWVVPITDFVASIPVRLREELADRMPPTDPSYPDAYALALSAASDLLRQQLRVRAERFQGESATPATPVRRASL